MRQRRGEDEVARGGGQQQFFSTCVSDGGSFNRAAGSWYYDPAMYLRSAATSTDVGCGADGASCGAARLSSVIAPRGLNMLVVGGNTGANYTLRHVIR